MEKKPKKTQSPLTYAQRIRQSPEERNEIALSRQAEDNLDQLNSDKKLTTRKIQDLEREMDLMKSAEVINSPALHKLSMQIEALKSGLTFIDSLITELFPEA